MHQHRPGMRRRAPKPMKPRPMSVAEFLFFVIMVMRKGTSPSRAKHRPTPVRMAGPLMAPGQQLRLLGEEEEVDTDLITAPPSDFDPDPDPAGTVMALPFSSPVADGVDCKTHNHRA